MLSQRYIFYSAGYWFQFSLCLRPAGFRIFVPFLYSCLSAILSCKGSGLYRESAPFESRIIISHFSQSVHTNSGTCNPKLIADISIIPSISFIKRNPTRCKNVSKFYYSMCIWSSTCLGRHIAYHQEPKTALATSGFSYVEGCWTCSWWTLSGTVCLTTSTNYTSNNLPRMKNQRLPVQF